MNKTEFALESFKNIQDLIKFIDQKSGAVLVITGLIFTGYVSFLKDLTITNLDSASFFGITSFIFGLTTVFFIITVIYLSIYKVLKPRAAENYTNEKESLFYAEHLSAMGKEKVISKYDTIQEEHMIKYLIEQQCEVSNILIQKTNELRKTFNFLFASIISLIIFIISTSQL